MDKHVCKFLRDKRIRHINIDSLCICACIQKPVYMCVEVQGMLARENVLFQPMWDLGFELTLSGSAESTFIHNPSCQQSFKCSVDLRRKIKKREKGGGILREARQGRQLFSHEMQLLGTSLFLQPDIPICYKHFWIQYMQSLCTNRYSASLGLSVS